MAEKNSSRSVSAQYERVRLSDVAGSADISQGTAVTPLALSNATTALKESVDEVAAQASAAQEAAEAAQESIDAIQIATDPEVEEALDEIFG